MAPFNPQLQPTNDPKYGEGSRPIEIPNTITPRAQEPNRILPEGNKHVDQTDVWLGKAAEAVGKGAGQAYKGLGDLFAGVAGTADFLGKMGDGLIKREIENQVYTMADAQRQEYTQALETLKGQPGALNLLSKGEDGMDANAQALPGELETLGENLGTLSSANQQGKLSNTYYYGQLLAKAKELRAKYPGYREFIDKEFAQVTGVNPANAYIQQMLGDLNRSITQLGSERNKALTLLKPHLGLPGAEELYQQVANGQKGINDVVKLVAPAERIKLEREERKANLADKTLTREEEQRIHKDETQILMSEKMANYFRAVKLSAGSPTPQSIMELTTQIANGERKPDDALMVQVSMSLDNTRARIANETWEYLNKRDSTGKSPLVRMGMTAEQGRKFIEENLQNFDRVRNHINTKQFDLAHAAMNDAQAQIDDAGYKVVNSDAGKWMKLVSVGKKLGGDVAAAEITRIALGGDYKDTIKTWVQNSLGDVAFQPNFTKSGRLITLKEKLTEAKNKSETGLIDPKVMKDLMEFPEKALSNKGYSDAVKENVVRGTFSEEAIGLIGMINKDGKRQDGSTIVGRNHYFTKMTSPEITKEVFRLAQAKPELWTMYVNWAERTFQQDLFRQDIAELEHIQSIPGTKMIWDTDNKRWELYRAPLGPLKDSLSGIPNAPRYGDVRDSQYNAAKTTLDRINMGLSNLGNIAKASGGNVDAYLLQSLIDWGYKPNQDVQRMSEEVFQSILASRKKELLKGNK